MSPLPARIVTVAIALALAGRCAVAPSPAPPVSTSSATASTTAHTSASAVAGAPLLVAWERRADEARLIVVNNGTIDRRPLPAVPNGPVVAGTNGPLGFLSGLPERPMLWTSRGSLRDPQWDAEPLAPAGVGDEPFVWMCLSPGSPARVAVQSDDNLVYVVDDGGRLRLLSPGLLLLRPGGCAWTDVGHVIVATDAPEPAFHIGFAMFDVDAGTSRVVPGNGGEAPAVSDGWLAFVARGQEEQSVMWIGAIPSADGPLRSPDLRIAPGGSDAGDLDFFHPVLSADGRRLAVVELARPATPRRLLVYDLFPTPTVVMELDVQGASDAGPAWVANAPANKV